MEKPEVQPTSPDFSRRVGELPTKWASQQGDQTFEPPLSNEAEFSD